MPSIFPSKHPIIGMIHLPPLIGFKDSLPHEAILSKALADLKSLVDGGIDAIMIENNYDLPHTRLLDTEVLVQFTTICTELRKATRLPLGICCLWNDWKSALSIARFADFQFVRIPVFVDHIRTHYGYEITENPVEILAYRKQLQAEHIQIFTDIHVKHSEILNPDSLEQSAIRAIEQGSDGLIITGKWTGDQPLASDLQVVRSVCPDAFIISGSGVTLENATQVLSVCDSAIVGTYFKTQTLPDHEINLRSFEESIDDEKVRVFMENTRSL